MNRIFQLVVISFISLITIACKAQDKCSSNYYEGIQPIAKTLRTQDICFNAYSVKYSIDTKLAVWSAEHLTKEKVLKARTSLREDAFHEESSLSTSNRVKLYYYTRSGYDKGHLAPSGDMQNNQEQYDSFSLINIVPQAPLLNRGAWADMEKSIRDSTVINGESYIITGIGFNEKNPIYLKDKVLIPSFMYKIIYYPSINKYEAYYANNTNEGIVTETTVETIESITGIKFFPEKR